VRKYSLLAGSATDQVISAEKIADSGNGNVLFVVDNVNNFSEGTTIGITYYYIVAPHFLSELNCSNCVSLVCE